MSKIPAKQLHTGTPEDVGQANVEGVSENVARADHVHAHGAQPLGDGLDHAAATQTTAGFLAPTDKAKLDGVANNATNTPLSSSAPAAVGTAGAAGTSSSAARADHVHAHGVQTDPSLHGLASASNAGFMSAADYTKLLNTASMVKAPCNLATTGPITLPNAGTSTFDGQGLSTGGRLLVKDQTVSAENGIYEHLGSGVFQRAADASVSSDFVLGMLVDVAGGVINGRSMWMFSTGTTPVVVGTTGQLWVQVASQPSQSTVPNDVSVGGTSAIGTLGRSARADHTHAVAVGTPSSIGTTNAPGSASSVARSDHVHAHGAQTDGTLHAVASGSVAGFMSTADYTKLAGIATGATNTPLSNATPAPLGTAAPGVGTAAARDDHTHAHGTQTDPTMHATASASAAGFLSAADYSAFARAGALVKKTCNLATTGPVTLTPGNAPTSVDGSILATNGRVLVKDQATSSENGIYVNNGGGNWSRATDADDSTDFAFGMLVTVLLGTVNAKSIWVYHTAVEPITLGTTGILFSQVGTGPSNATPAALPVGGAGAVGTAGQAARADHVHPLSAGTPVAIGTANADGVATTAARSDHVHSHGAQTDPTLHAAVVAGGNAGFMTGADKTKLDGIASGATSTPLSSTAPSSVGTANTVGVGTTAARHDHVHAHGAQTDGTLHAVATGSVAGFLSAADYTKLLGIPSNADNTVAALAAASAAISVNGQRITNLGTPTAGTDAATKAYCDAIAQGLDVKNSCRAIATTSLSLTGAATVDGVVLATNDRVLAAGQSTASANGIYVVNTAGAWTRATDADSSAKVTSGLFTFVTEGTANANTGWVLATPDPITLGTTSLSFTQFSGAGQINPGTGLTKSGNTLNVGANADGSIVVNADDVQVGVLATDAQHGTRGGGTLHAAANGSTAGFLSAADYTKLQGIATGATNTPLSSTTPAAVGTAAVGVGTTAARADHVHGHGAQASDGTMHAVVVAGGNAGFMSGADKTKLDGVATGATATPLSSTTPAAVGTAAVGVGTSAARGDHVHAHGAQAADGTMHAAANGTTAGFMSAADYTKLQGIAAGATNLALASTNPGNILGNQGAFVGSGTTAARADHVHGISFGVPASITDTNSAGGASQAFAASDHTHAHGTHTNGTYHAVANGVTAGFMSAADYLKLAGIYTAVRWIVQVYINGSVDLTQTSGFPVDQDGATITANALVLLANQPSAAQNGIYQAVTPASPNTWVRAAGASAASDFVTGSLLWVVQGNNYGGALWAFTTSGAITLGTTPLGFKLLSGVYGNTTQAVGASANQGVNPYPSRADHVHAHGSQTDGTMHAVATTSVAGFLSAADKTKLDGVATGATNLALSSTVPLAVAQVGTVGAGTTAARSNHVHPHGAQVADDTMHAAASASNAGFMSAADYTKLSGIATGATNTPLAQVGVDNPGSVGLTGSVGVSTKAARADHTHVHGSGLDDGSMHALASASLNGFLSAADKSKLDTIAAGATTSACKAMAHCVHATNVANFATGAPATSSDSTALFNGARVLVVGQTNQAENGIYVVGTIGSGSNGTWTRAPDADSSEDFVLGMIVITRQSAGLNSASIYVLTFSGASVVVGTTALTFSKVNGLSLTGPNPVGATAAVGSGGDAARWDHVHAHGNQAAGNLLHAAVTTSVNGFMIAADKSKLDGLVDARWLLPCACATTVSVDTTAGAPNVVDGYSVQVGDRVLVKDNTPQSQNGVYVVNTVGTGGNGAWTRATDFAAGATLSPATKVSILSGTVNQGTHWMASPASYPMTVGTTSIGFLSCGAPFAVNTPLSIVDSAAAIGTLNRVAREDHVHAHGNLAGGSQHALVVNGGAAGFMSGNDKFEFDALIESGVPMVRSAPGTEWFWKMPDFPRGSTALALTSNMVYAVCLGYTTRSFTCNWLQFYQNTAAAGADNGGQWGIATGTVSPLGGAVTITPIAVTGFPTMTTTGVKQNASALGVTVPSGVYVWAFIKSLFATTQIGIQTGNSEAFGRIQTRATVGTIVVNTPITMTATVFGGPDLGIRCTG